MKTIKFFHPEETFTYYIEKCFCKVVYSGNRHQLLIEIHSTDDLDHIEADSLQNDFAQVILSVDDFPVPVSHPHELVGKTLEIPLCYIEQEDEEGEIEEIFYTNVNFSEGNFEADHNQLSFYKDDSGTLCLKWKGKVQDFTEDSDDYIPFELECAFLPASFEERD
ncbi:MAG TPA: hypothetical protein VKY36_07810 [Moheibacter sp.]|nr:hypothetical protein [Moheibacter sp.]